MNDVPERSESKTRRALRYVMPLEATVEIADEKYEAGVLDISSVGCRIHGNLPGLPLWKKGSCKIAFRLSEGYSIALARLVPQEPARAVMWRTQDASHGFHSRATYISEFVDSRDGRFVNLLAKELRKFPRLTWRAGEAYVPRIVDLSERFLHIGLTRGCLDQWLEKILHLGGDNRKTHAMRALALDILGIAMSRYHYSHERCENMAKELWGRILKLEGVENNRNRVRLFPLDIEAKSGHVTLYTIRVANNLPNHICRENLLRINSQVELQRLENVEWVVLVDDFLGSGKTANKYLGAFQRLARVPTREVVGQRLADLLKNKRTALACFAGFFDRAKWEHDRNKYPFLKGFDDVIIVDELRKDQDTVDSDAIVPDAKRKIWNDLLRMTEQSKLFLQGSKNSAKGYDQLGALVSFYYSTPNNSLPLLWSRRGGWKGPLPKRFETTWKRLEVPRPRNVPLTSDKTREKVIRELDGEARCLGIFGGPSCGKSNLAAEIADYYGRKLCKNVIWHEFGDVCSLDSFYCHIGWFLAEVCSLHDLRDHYFKGETPKRLCEILVRELNELKAYIFLGGIDRIRHKDLWYLILRLIESTSHNVKIVVTCRTDVGNVPPLWIAGSVSQLLLDPLEKTDVINIFNSVSSAKLDTQHALAELVWYKSCAHPIAAWVLGSLYRKQPRLFESTVSGWQIDKTPLASSTRNLFDVLESDLRWFLLVASVFVSPFSLDLLDGPYKNGIRKKVVGRRNFRTMAECLESLERKWKTPFIFRSEGLQYEMPVYLRDEIYDMWNAKSDYRAILECQIAQLFEARETHEAGHRMDFVEIAHRHYLRAGSFADCLRLLSDNRELFKWNNGNSRLLRLTEQTLDKVGPEKPEALLHMRAKLLGQLTKYESLRKLCQEEVPRLLPRMPVLSQARFALTEARLSGSRRDFGTAWKAFRKLRTCLNQLQRRRENVAEFRELELKALLRRCQVRMSQGAYNKAWVELRHAVTKLQENDGYPLIHELAVACRHMYTLLYLNAEYAGSLVWAEVALELSARLSDYEGIAIMQYKLAKSWLGLGNLRNAEDYSVAALRTFDAHVSGGRWWRMAFLETSAQVQLARYEQNRGLSDCLDLAEQALKQAESLSEDMRELEKEESIRAHLSEIYQARAFLEFLRGRRWQGYWHLAYRNLRVDPDDSDSVVDVFRRSQLYYDHAYYKRTNQPVTSERVDAVIVPALREAANMLRNAGLSRAAKKPLELLADVTHEQSGLELTELEALFRVTRIEAHSDEPILLNLERTEAPLRRLLVKSKIDPEGLEPEPVSQGRVNQARIEIENALSHLIDKWLHHPSAKQIGP